MHKSLNDEARENEIKVAMNKLCVANKALLDDVEKFRDTLGAEVSFVSCLAFDVNSSVACSGSLEDMFCAAMDIVSTLYKHCDEPLQSMGLTYNFLKNLCNNDSVGIGLVAQALQHIQAEHEASEKDLPGLPRWEDVQED